MDGFDGIDETDQAVCVIGDCALYCGPRARHRAFEKARVPERAVKAQLAAFGRVVIGAHV
jgi:hypothetical protein